MNDFDLTSDILSIGNEVDAIPTVGGVALPSIKGIYRNRFQMASLMQVPVSDATAELEYAAADRNNAAQGDTFTIAGETFKIEDFEYRDETRIISRLSKD